MKKEREVIAKNNHKKFIIFVLVAFLVSLPTSFNFLKNPDFRWLGIFFMSVIIFTVIFSLIMVIILPNYAIVKERENLIIWQGIFKTVLQIKTISNVEIVPLQNGEIMSKNGNILIKVKNESNEGKVFTINVKNKEEVVERLNLLINQSVS
ncbi:MAG: hypothetical protein IKA72_04930 [Clostridia bacterium]|nr:hypothetical protein [Clostridia bacterium]